MDNYFIEFRGREKVGELIEDGLRSQALHRSGALKASLFAGGMRLGLGLMIGLGLIAALLAR
jgi:hypothetical protein